MSNSFSADNKLSILVYSFSSTHPDYIHECTRRPWELRAHWSSGLESERWPSWQEQEVEAQMHTWVVGSHTGEMLSPGPYLKNTCMTFLNHLEEVYRTNQKLSELRDFTLNVKTEWSCLPPSITATLALSYESLPWLRWVLQPQS